MRSVLRCFSCLLLLQLFASVTALTGQEMRGRMRVLVPPFATDDRAMEQRGARLAESVRRGIDELATHVSVEPKRMREALKRANRTEADMDCVSWRQLARLVEVDLVLCGRLSSTGQVTASFVSSDNDALFDVPPFALSTDQDAAQRIVTAFNEFIEQISQAYYCAEAIRSEGWEQALEACREAVASNPNSVHAHYHLASALIRLERVADALKSYERVIELDAGHSEALLGAGVTASRLGQHELSRKRLEEYLELNPGEEQVRISVASRLAAEGDALAALQLMEAALKRPDAGAASYLYAGHFALAAADRASEAEQKPLLEAGLAHYAGAEQRGHTPDVTTLRGTVRALTRLNRTADAVAAGERAVGLFADDANLWSVYADALRDAGRTRDAVAALDRVAALAPDQPRLGARRALLLIELNRPQDAVAAATQSIDRGEIDAAAAESIAQTFVRYVTRMNPIQHELALSYLSGARQLGKSERTVGMINHVHGFVLYRQAEQLAKPMTPASATQALPLFRAALTQLQNATGYTEQAENRRSLIEATQRYIEIQEALIKRGR